MVELCSLLQLENNINKNGLAPGAKASHVETKTSSSDAGTSSSRAAESGAPQDTEAPRSALVLPTPIKDSETSTKDEQSSLEGEVGGVVEQAVGEETIAPTSDTATEETVVPSGDTEPSPAVEENTTTEDVPIEDPQVSEVAIPDEQPASDKSTGEAADVAEVKDVGATV